MMPDTLEIGLDILAVLLTGFIILRTFPLMRGEKPMTAALFLFAMTSLLLAYAYWLAYTLMRPEARMPFAANEIGEIAVFLLLSATLETVFRESRIDAKREMFFAALFASASVALWIGWTGEWIQDIIGGLAFGYFLCICVRSLKQTDALNKSEWLALGVSCAVLILGQAGTFLVPAAYKNPLDLFCYAVMFAVLIWLIVKSILCARKKAGRGAELALSCSAYAFSLSTMYMSADWFYQAAMLLSLITLPLMLLAVRREVTA